MKNAHPRVCLGHAGQGALAGTQLTVRTRRPVLPVRANQSSMILSTSWLTWDRCRPGIGAHRSTIRHGREPVVAHVASAFTGFAVWKADGLERAAQAIATY